METAAACSHQELVCCAETCSYRLGEDVWEMQKVEILRNHMRQQAAQLSSALPSCFPTETLCHTIWQCLPTTL